MTQLMILISLVGLLIGNTVADVLVQPGFEQPSPSLLQQPIVQPFSTLPHVGQPGLFQPRNPGYHLELHPVFGNLGHSTGGLGYLQGHDVLPLSWGPSRRLHPGGPGGLGFPGTRRFISPQIPVPGLRRFRRSTGEQPNAMVQREKRSSDAVATKSTLNDDNPTVVDMLNQDTEEKHVEARYSNNAHARSSSTLLGLNPSSMYPVQNQYRFVMPTYGLYPQIVNEHPKIASQMNPLVAIQEQGTPQTNPEDSQRNYPDPRPVTTTQSPAKALKNDRNKFKNTAMSREAKIPTPTDDQEIVGSSAGHHIHQPGRFIPRNNVINEAYSTCGCSNPSCVVYNGNDETANKLASTQLDFQQPAQVYQLVPVQSYSNPIVNYDKEYPTGFTGAYYMQDFNTLPVQYQFG